MVRVEYAGTIDGIETGPYGGAGGKIKYESHFDWDLAWSGPLSVLEGAGAGPRLRVLSLHGNLKVSSKQHPEADCETEIHAGPPAVTSRSLTGVLRPGETIQIGVAAPLHGIASLPRCSPNGSFIGAGPRDDLYTPQPVFDLLIRNVQLKNFNGEWFDNLGAGTVATTRLTSTVVFGGAGCTNDPKQELDSFGACYVALGDSFSSGQAPPLVPGGEGCFRSKYGYPVQYDPKAAFVACSGAKIDVVRDTQLPALSRATKLVTVTVGGNDSPLFDKINQCLAQELFLKCQDLKPLDFGDLRARLVALYRAIRERSPAARIFVLEYPIPVPAKVPDSPCPELFVPGAPTGLRLEAPYFHAQMERLNAVVKAAVAASGVARFVPTQNAFEGKDVCSPDSLFFAVGVYNGDYERSLHPSRAGQAVMARLLRAAAGPPPE